MRNVPPEVFSQFFTSQFRFTGSIYLFFIFIFSPKMLDFSPLVIILLRAGSLFFQVDSISSP